MKTKSSIDSLLAIIASVFEAYSVGLFLQDNENQPARLISSFSMDNNIANNCTIAPGKGLVGWVLRHKAPLLVDSIEENQAYLGYYKEECEPDIRTFMGCPIPGGGALCVDSKKAQAFVGSRQKLLHLFALLIPQLQQAASSSGVNREVNTYFTAIEHLTELRLAYTGWSSYLQALLKILKETTGFQYTAFASAIDGSPTFIVEGEYPMLLNQENSQAELPVNTGIVGWVLRNGQAVFNEGSAGNVVTPVFGKHPQVPDFASVICLPLIIEHSTIAVLCLASLEPRMCGDEMRSFLRMVTAEIAILLENISLRFKVRKLLPKANLHQDGALIFDPDCVNNQSKPDPEN